MKLDCILHSIISICKKNLLVLSFLGLIYAQPDSLDIFIYSQAITAGDSIDVTVIAYKSGDIDTSYSGNVSLDIFLNVEGTNNFQGYISPSTIAMIHGIATAKPQVRTAGDSAVIRASTSGLESESQSFDVYPGSPDRIFGYLPAVQVFSPGYPGGIVSLEEDLEAGKTEKLLLFITDKYFNRTSITDKEGITITSTDSFASISNYIELSTGVETLDVTFYRAQNTDIFLNASNYADDTISIDVKPSAFSRFLLILPGEVLIPGDTDTTSTFSGKSGTPDIQYIGVPFNIKVYATDMYANITDSVTGDTVLVTSQWGDSSSGVVIMGEANIQFTIFSSGRTAQLTAYDLSSPLITPGSAELEVRSKAFDIDIVSITPQVIETGDTAKIEVLVKDIKNEPIPGKLVNFTVVSGKGEIEPDSIPTNEEGLAYANLLSINAWSPETDTIRVRADDVEEKITVFITGSEWFNNSKVVVYPNPIGVSSDNAKIEYLLTEPHDYSLLQIFDSFGEIVIERKLQSETGINTFEWDSKNDKGYSVASGIYEVRVRAYRSSRVVEYLKTRIGVVR